MLLIERVCVRDNNSVLMDAALARADDTRLIGSAPVNVCAISAPDTISEHTCPLVLQHTSMWDAPSARPGSRDTMSQPICAHLAPVRFFIDCGVYGFVWNDDEQRVETNCAYPPVRRQRDRTENHVSQIAAASEYPSELVLQWALDRIEMAHQCAKLDVESSAVVVCDASCMPAIPVEPKMKDRVLRSYGAHGWEAQQTKDSGHSFMLRNRTKALAIVAGPYTSTRYKVGAVIVETLNANVSMRQTSSLVLTCEDYRQYAMRSLTDEGTFMPPHAVLEYGAVGDVLASHAVLYDGRVAIATSCTVVGYWRDTYVVVWDHQSTGANRQRSARVKAVDRSQIRTLWQLPSYARDYETCRTILRHELEAVSERGLVNIIASYICLPTSALSRRFCGERYAYVQLHKPSFPSQASTSTPPSTDT